MPTQPLPISLTDLALALQWLFNTWGHDDDPLASPLTEDEALVLAYILTAYIRRQHTITDVN